MGSRILRDAYQNARSKGNNIVDLYYANALVLTKNSNEAIPIIRSAIKENPSEPYLHFLLSRAYAEQGDVKNSFVQRAEFHYKRGNYEFSIQQFKRAFVLVKTDYERARLAARIEDIEREIDSIKRLL